MPTAREADEAAQKALDGLPYRREADELITAMYESGYNSTRRTRVVAEYLAAHFQYRTPEGPDHSEPGEPFVDEALLRRELGDGLQ